MGQLFKKLKENYELAELGGLLCIPWGFPRTQQQIPGWTRESYTIITANTGQGKTKFAKFTIIKALKYLIENYGIKAKVKWYALEESEDSFKLSLIIMELAEQYNIHYELSDLMSYKMKSDTPSGKMKAALIPKEHLNLIEKLDDYVEEKYISFVEVVTNIRNATGIYKDMRSYYHSIGKDILDSSGHIIDYKQNNDEFVFCVIDHASFLIPEKINNTFDQWHSLQHLSQEYLSHQLKDRFKCAVVLIQQQASETERVEFFKGEAIAQKLEPTLNGLGIYKNTQQDATMVVGLFKPARYGITTYYNYDIAKLKHNAVFIKMLKDRKFGKDDLIIPTWFDGARNIFKELPPPDSEEMKKIYKTIS
jgi:hypothetical protein